MTVPIPLVGVQCRFGCVDGAIFHHCIWLYTCIRANHALAYLDARRVNLKAPYTLRFTTERRDFSICTCWRGRNALFRSLATTLCLYLCKSCTGTFWCPTGKIEGAVCTTFYVSNEWNIDFDKLQLLDRVVSRRFIRKTYSIRSCTFGHILDRQDCLCLAMYPQLIKWCDVRM